MILAATAHNAWSSWLSWLLVAVAVLASGLLIAGPVLRRRYPVAWWLALGYPAACFRVVRT